MAQLRQRKTELDRLGAQVLVISFVDNEHWIEGWLDETQSPFPFLLDPDLEVYEAYGLKKSIVRVWSPKVMWHYLKLILKGQRLRSIQGNPHQLGGDFIVDGAGILRLVHRSDDPTDRPAVDELLSVLRQLPVTPDQRSVYGEH